MRYSLEKDNNGRITQCENGDGNNNVYAQRKELNKLALENLKRPTPGKLGNLANLQVFNFNISDFATGTVEYIEKDYNTTSGFPANATQTVMFGTDSTTDQALYYNIVYLNARFNVVDVLGNEVLPTSSIRFYLLQNILGFTGSAGTKIPQPSPLIGVGGGAVTYTTSGNVFGFQQIASDIYNDQPLYAQNNTLKGFRASGLALSQIKCNFSKAINTANVTIEVEIGVDNSSVSTTY